MNKLALLTFVVIFFCVDLKPLNDITKHLIVKRSNGSLPEGNSSIACNETLGNCNNITLNNSTKKENLTIGHVNSTNVRLNLTDVCQQNLTLNVRCNGSLVNLTKHCNNSKVQQLLLHCVNESGNASTSNSTLAKQNATLNTSSETGNNTASNISAVNNTALNGTGLNVTVVNGTTNINSTTPNTTVSNPSNASNTMTPTLSVSPSSSSIGQATASIQDSNSIASSSVKVTNSAVVPSTTIAVVAQQSATTVPTTPQSTTPKSTTSQSTTAQSTAHQTTTPQSTTPKSTTPQSTTPKSTTPQSTTPKSTTPQATKSQTTTLTTSKPTTDQPTTTKTTELPTTQTKKETPDTTEEVKTVKTDVVIEESISTSHQTATTHPKAVTTMESPYNSAKNIKFFYVNVLIPVGIGVCGALFIALIVLLFKCCRKNKVKKVRYFGKPKGYSRNKMDQMNLLDNSSDEE